MCPCQDSVESVLLLSITKLLLDLTLDPYVPYKISIAAKNSNPILGEGKEIIAFSLEGGK